MPGSVMLSGFSNSSNAASESSVFSLAISLMVVPLAEASLAMAAAAS